MPNTDRIQSTRTAFAILDHVAANGGASVAELEELTELSRTSIYKHLRTLEDVGAVENRAGTFHIGPKLPGYARRQRSGTHAPAHRPRVLDDLARSLDAPVNLWVRDDADCERVHRALPAEKRETPRDLRRTLSLLGSCPGKTMLAHVPAAERERVIEDHGEGSESNRFREQVRSIRSRNVLIEALESGSDWLSVSTPLLTRSDRPWGALEVVIPSERSRGIDVEVNITGALLNAAADFD